MADGAFRQMIRRLIPRRLRWLARAAFKRITGLYYRDMMTRLSDVQSQVNSVQDSASIVREIIRTEAAQIETQGEVMELLLRRLRVSQEEVTAQLRTLEEQVSVHLRTLEEVATKDTQQVAALTGTVNLVQAQVALLRAHLYASDILGPVTLKTKTLQRVFEEARANTPQEAAAVEIGCIRYPFESPLEGASTLYFARWCRDANRKFISVDVEREHLENARRLLDEQDLAADLIHADGQEAISKLSVPIGLLYLDGSNDPDETLEQFKAAEDKLAAGAIVAIDDVQQIDSNSMGKGQSAIPYAKERGWKAQVLDTDPGYRMAVLRRPKRARRR